MTTAVPMNNLLMGWDFKDLMDNQNMAYEKTNDIQVKLKTHWTVKISKSTGWKNQDVACLNRNKHIGFKSKPYCSSFNYSISYRSIAMLTTNSETKDTAVAVSDVYEGLIIKL